VTNHFKLKGNTMKKLTTLCATGLLAVVSHQAMAADLTIAVQT
jgi:hypothetical protein